jgi:DNA-binding transcriptional LysR family regulator
MPARLPQMRQLETFRAVMLSGSVSRGAALLGISQPAASRLLRDLEAVLGLVLFERRPGGRLAATDDARLLFEPVERHAAAAEAVASAAQALRASRAARLRLAAGPTLAQQLLPEILARVVARHPDISLSLVTGNAAEVANLVVRHAVDLGVAAATSPIPGVETRILSSGVARCVVPADWPLARSAEVSLSDLHGLPFIGIGGEGLFQISIAAALRNAGVQPQVRLEAPSSSAAAVFAAQGMGAAIIDPFAARQVEGARLKVLKLATPIPYESALLRAHVTPVRGPVATFVAALAEQGLAPARPEPALR